MRVRSRSVLWVMAVALVAASCGGSGDQPALCNLPGDLAVVDGATITCEDMYELRPEYGDLDVVAPGEQVRGDLTRLIQNEAFVRAAEDQYGIVLSEADYAARLADPPLRWAPEVSNPQLPEEQRKVNALISLVSDAVVPHLVVEEYGSVAAFAAQRPEAVVQVCVRTIVVPTQEEAFVVLDRIDAGEAFADLERELSLAAQQFPEGRLTINGVCPVSVSQLGEEFVLATALAPIGEVSGPTRDEGGFYHVFIVDERVAPDTGTELGAEFLQLLDRNVQSELFGQWASDVLRDAEIEVASQIGRWSAASFAIAPPGFVTPGG